MPTVFLKLRGPLTHPSEGSPLLYTLGTWLEECQDGVEDLD